MSHDSEVVAKGQQVITACAFIHRVVDEQEKVFLAKRAATKKFLPGKWELPGGHIDFGESPEAGLKREIKEEFGVNIELGDPFAVFTYANEIKGSHSIEVIYFAKLLDDPDKISLNHDDHSEANWFSPAEATGLSNAEDDEVIAIRKGFNLLEGGGLNVAT